MYNLFLDDERNPGDIDYQIPNQGFYGLNDPNNWVIVRTVEEAKNIIAEKGFPQFISFDNDLGKDQPEGYDFAKWIVEQDIDNECIPEAFGYVVHSQNCKARDNIRGLLNNYAVFKGVLKWDQV